MYNKEDLILGLDVSTTTIGISVLRGDETLYKLDHLSLKKIKKKDYNNETDFLFDKANSFKKFIIENYGNFKFSEIIIEEPLIHSNNSRTIATLLKFNGMVSFSMFEIFGLKPEYISTYDSRSLAFPELVSINPKSKSKKPTLFGAYPKGIDKKKIILDKVSKREPDIKWLYRDKGKRKGEIREECYDSADAYTCALAWIKKHSK